MDQGTLPSAVHAFARFAGGRVLVADDDLAVLASMRSLLESWGLEVSLATGVAEAVAAAWQGAPDGFDVLIADWRLRDGERGTALIDAVRAAAGRRWRRR